MIKSRELVSVALQGCLFPKNNTFVWILCRLSHWLSVNCVLFVRDSVVIVRYVAVIPSWLSVILPLCWRTKDTISSHGNSLKDPRSKIQDSRFKIQDPRFKIRDPRSKIQLVHNVYHMCQNVYQVCHNVTQMCQNVSTIVSDCIIMCFSMCLITCLLKSFN